MSIFSLATFGAGCFWGVEETFRKIPGVKQTAVGYMGGVIENPTYEQVCTDETGHAEVVEMQFDPAEVSYQQLLEVFWKSHNPTEHNRQGPDIGTQYRSVIFYHTSEQEKIARVSKQTLEQSNRFSHPIATEIVPAGIFYQAEEYHQKYLARKEKMICG